MTKCECDVETGECQAPLGCRLRTDGKMMQDMTIANNVRQTTMQESAAEIERLTVKVAMRDGVQCVAYEAMVNGIERLTGEKSYLSDEVIPALKAEVEGLAKENERLREALREPIGLTCVHDVTMSNKPSRACVCHTSWIKMGEELRNNQQGLDNGRKA